MEKEDADFFWEVSGFLTILAIIGGFLVATTHSDKVELTDVLGWVFMSFLPLFLIYWYFGERIGEGIKQCICPARENRNGGNSAGSQGRVQRFQIEVL